MASSFGRNRLSSRLPGSSFPRDLSQGGGGAAVSSTTAIPDRFTTLPEEPALLGALAAKATIRS
jgi:hypothetical protein